MLELDFSCVRCLYNTCFIKSGRIIIMERIVPGLETERLLFCALWEL